MERAISEQQLIEVIRESLPVGFSRVDDKGIILEFNATAEKITGYSRSEVIGRPHLKVIHGSIEPQTCPFMTQTLEKRIATIDSEASVRTKHGEIVLLSVTSAPIFDSEGNFLGGIELFRDITERKRLEQERKNILAMISHDMRNPLVVMGGFLKRLQEGKAGSLNEKQHEYLKFVMEELGKLEQLVSRNFEFAKYEAEEQPPELAPYDVRENIGRIIELQKVQSAEKNITIAFKGPDPDNIPLIKADAAIVDRVLTNLLDNAFKYTEPGGIVTVSVINRERDILVEVSDTGKGILPEELPRIFDAFYRPRQRQEGTGLGLAVAKKMITAHGGRIWVESKPGVGSTFRFTLPKR